MRDRLGSSLPVVQDTPGMVTSPRDQAQRPHAVVYVRREIWRDCEHGTRVATCCHRPRCGPLTPGQPPGQRPFGRTVEGWTRTTAGRAPRETAAWQAGGWTVTEVLPASAEVRRRVTAWERRAKGYPGEAERSTR